jgi:ribose transport system permease protein
VNLEALVSNASILAVTGFGMTFVIAMRGLDLSVGSIEGFAVIIIAELLQPGRGVPLAIAVLAGVAVGASLGCINGLLVSYLKMPSFVATLATFSMILGGELLITNTATLQMHRPAYSRLIVGSIGGVLPAAAVEAAVILAVLWVVFTRTTFGRHVAALGGDAKAAIGAGINVRAVTIGVFVLVGACAGISGAMTGGQLQSANSTVGSGFELLSIAVVVVGGTSLTGGRGNLFGTAVAALLVETINSGLTLLGVSSSWDNLILGTILILALALDALRPGRRRRGMLVV